MQVIRRHFPDLHVFSDVRVDRIDDVGYNITPRESEEREKLRSRQTEDIRLVIPDFRAQDFAIPMTCDFVEAGVCCADTSRAGKREGFVNGQVCCI
jgi:hypothetical protein